jgi:prolyl-tRNA synthetase
VALEARFLDEDGREKPLVMGSYGIGPGRVMAASVEQRHDETGLCWPFALAPYHVHVVVLPGVDEQAEAAAAELDRAGVDVLLDDRDLRAGEKFADADLIGLPFRVTVGKKTLEDGKVDLKDSETGADGRVGVTELSKEVLNGKTS